MDELEVKRRTMILFHRLGKIAASMDFAVLPKGDFIVLETTEKYEKKYPDRPGMPVAVLVNELKNAPSSVSRTLRRLEEKGCIERIVDKGDRRNVYVRITETGNRLRREVKQQVDCFMERVIGQMGAEDMEQLLALWERFALTATNESEMMCERRIKSDDENHEVSQGE